MYLEMTREMWMNPTIENLRDTLDMTRRMQQIAENGHQQRNDSSCGLLYSVLRSEADRIRQMATERLNHIESRTPTLSVTLKKREDQLMNKYECIVCGYVENGDETPHQCRQCMAPASRFVKKPQPEEGSAASDTEKKAD